MRPAARRILKILSEGSLHFFQFHGLVYSAAIAFNLLLAAIPILFLVFAAAAALIGSNELPFETLTWVLRDTFPYGARVLVPILRELIASGATFGVVGTCLLLFTSYSATDAVHTSLGVMLGAREEKRFWHSALFHVVLVLVLIVLTSAAILLPHVWAGMEFLTRELYVEWVPALQAMIAVFGDVFLAGIVFLAGALTYRYLSPRRVRLENALAGSLMFLLLLYLIKTGFVIYVKRFSRLNIIYGSLFSIICFIIVAYLFAAAYLFCASIIGTLERLEGEEASPGREQGAGTDGAAGID